MKYIKTFESYRSSVNEEFLGGLFKGLKNKMSLGFSKMFGAAGKADKILDEYKTEILNVQNSKIESLKAYGEYMKTVIDTGEKDEKKLEELKKNIEKADTNFQKQVELIKQKYDIKIKEIVDEEDNKKIQNYINLKKIELQQELLANETKTLLTDTGLTEEQLKDDPIISGINSKITATKEKMEEEKKELEKKEEQKDTGEVSQDIIEEGELYIYENSDGDYSIVRITADKKLKRVSAVVKADVFKEEMEKPEDKRELGKLFSFEKNDVEPFRPKEWSKLKKYKGEDKFKEEE
jgi:hypothetical protein